MAMVGGAVFQTTLTTADPAKCGVTPGSLILDGFSTWVPWTSGIPTDAPIGSPVMLAASTGLAASLFQARLAARLTAIGVSSSGRIWPIPVAGYTGLPFSVIAPATQDMVTASLPVIVAITNATAGEAQADAVAIVSYLQANAEAVISPTTNLNLVVPTPNTSGTAIGDPSAPVNLPIT